MHKKDNKGFTIIEVLIVLAIAGLILIVVFLAIPPLQRNSRNNNYQAEANRVGSAVGEVVNNGGGGALVASNWTVGTAGGTTDAEKVSKAANLNAGSVYQRVLIETESGSSVPSITATTSGSTTTPATIVVKTGAKCASASGTGSSSASLTDPGTVRQAVIISNFETSSGSNNFKCIEI